MLTLLAPGSPDYAQAFRTLMRCTENADTHLRTLLQRLAENLPSPSHAVDWGAGAGRFTRVLCDLFDVVYAVEPNLSMRQELVNVAPSARVLDTAIALTILPEPVDLGLISHVYYHIPDHEWGGHTLHCASQLSATGVLLIALKHPDTACNDMLEAFGAPRFNLFSLVDVFRRHPEYRVSFQVAPSKITTHSFEDTVTIARFMLSDRATAFSQVPSQQEVEDYVRQHLWDAARACGGWDIPEVIVSVSRNPLL